MLPYLPLSPCEAIRVQALAQRLGTQPVSHLWAQAQAVLTSDGQEVLALLMDKLQIQPFRPQGTVAHQPAKVRLAAVYHRWLMTLH